MSAPCRFEIAMRAAQDQVHTLAAQAEMLSHAAFEKDGVHTAETKILSLAREHERYRCGQLQETM